MVAAMESTKMFVVPATATEILESRTPLFGKYQLLLVIAYGLTMCSLSANLNFMAFGALKPEFSCSASNTTSARRGMNLPVYDCRLAQNCTRNNHYLTIHPPEFHSVVMQWSLFCDRSRIINAVTTFQLVGVIVGSGIGSGLSAFNGRKSTLTYTLFASICLGCFSTLTTSWQMFAVCRFMIGLCVGAQMAIAWLLVAEQMAEKHRRLFRLFAITGITHLNETLIAFATKDWALFSIISNIEAIPALIILGLFTHESPLWLIRHGRVAKAVDVLNSMAIANRGTSDMSGQELDLSDEPGSGPGGKKPGYGELMGTPKQIKSILGASIVWFMLGLASSGLYYDIGNLTGNIYFATFVLGCLTVLQIPFAFLNEQFSEGKRPIFQRKWTLLGVVLLAASSCTLLVLLRFTSGLRPWYGYVITLATALAQVFIAVSLEFAHSHLTDLFPSHLQARAVTVCSIAARVGAAVAPQLYNLDYISAGSPYICFLTATCIATVFIFSSQAATITIDLTSIRKTPANISVAEYTMSFVVSVYKLSNIELADWLSRKCARSQLGHSSEEVNTRSLQAYYELSVAKELVQDCRLF